MVNLTMQELGPPANLYSPLRSHGEVHNADVRMDKARLVDEGWMENLMEDEDK